jgi:hypothetical protein
MDDLCKVMVLRDDKYDCVVYIPVSNITYWQSSSTPGVIEVYLKTDQYFVKVRSDIRDFNTAYACLMYQDEVYSKLVGSKDKCELT